MKWFCIALACLGLIGGLIDCTPVSPTDTISETVLLKREEPHSSIPGVDIMLRFANAFTGALTEMIKGKEKEVITYRKEVQGVADRIPVDSMPIRKDLMPKEAATLTKQMQDVADKFPIGSIPLKMDQMPNTADLAPNPAVSIPNPADSQSSPDEAVDDAADDAAVDDAPKQSEDVGPNPEATESDSRKRRSASPIDTKVVGGPRIEDRYNIEAASVESSLGKFINQPKGLLTSCPNHEGGPVIIMIKKVNNLKFATDDSECDDCD